MNNIPVLSYVRRNIALLVCYAASFALFKWEAAFQEAGPAIFLPMLFVQAVLLGTLVRHFFWRNTVDEYARMGGFANDWWKVLKPEERVRWTVVITLVLILCATIIAGALAK
jgi:hypothetical protein